MKVNLRNLRQAHSMFQSDMAELLKTNQSTISRMELKDGVKLSYPQLQALYEKFGKEDVDAFAVSDEDGESIAIVATNNTNNGEGIQNNGYLSTDAAAMGIIRQQAESLSKLAAKQAEQTDRLIVLLEKLSDKL